jgi:Glycosyltransferase 61
LIAPYVRLQPPEGVDHSGFGEACSTLALTDSRSVTDFERTIYCHPSVDLPQGRAYTPPLDGEPADGFIRACRVEFADCCTGEFAATAFLPESALYASDSGAEYLVDESLWHSELFFSDWFRNDVTTDWKWRVKREWRPSLSVEEPINFCYHCFHYQYFHWLMDSLPRVWLLQRRRAAVSSAKWLVGPLNTPMHVATLRLFDVRPEDCVWFEPQVVEFKRSVHSVFRFHEPIGLRPSFNDGVHHKGWSPDYLQELRDRAIARHGHPTGPDNLRLYVARGDSGHRQIVNDSDVRALMEEFGFTIVTPGTLSFEQQVSMFSRARVIVGTHGAGMTNIIWAPPGARVLEFMPYSFGDPNYRFITQFCGHQYSCLYVKWLEHPRGIAYANIEVDIPTLRQALADVVS